jgi:DeoR/GlpR family transcriptional regulator of sugar metabolism
VFAKVAPTFDVSRQTISNDFSALESEGKVKRNGDGIEVLAA